MITPHRRTSDPLAQHTGRRAIALLALALLAGAALPAPAALAHPAGPAQIGAVDSLLRADPGDAALLRRRAELMRLAGNLAGAADALAAAERAAPNDPRNRVIRGRLSLDRGDLHEALDHAGAVLAAHPREPLGWALRAEARARLGAHALAAADLDRAIACSDVPSPELFLERARLRAAAGDERGALASLDGGIARLGPAAALEHEAVAIEARLGRFEAALCRLERLAPRYARRAPLLARRGDLLQRAGRIPEAIAAWSEALLRLESRPILRRDDAALARELRAQLHAAARALQGAP